MKEVMRTPVLHAFTSTGKTKHWFCKVVTEQGIPGEYRAYLISEAWQTWDGGESKHLVSTPAEVKGKNLGKSNESSAVDQAVFEAQAKARKKCDEGYSADGAQRAMEREFTLPMLAHPFGDKVHTLTYPVYLQPKYDGCRCLYNSEIGHWSRQGNLFIKEVVAHLGFDTGGLTFDGELMLPAPATFQESIAAIKKFRPGVSTQLKYHVYDLVDDGTLPFNRRYAVLEAMVKELKHPSVVLAPTHRVTDEADVALWHATFVKQGFEGAIIRTSNGKYQAGHRSKDLLKLKSMMDAEFKIVGVEDGVGKDAGLAIFVCVTKEGNEFRARPEGTVEVRAQMYQDRKKLVNKLITVRYQNMSDDLVPRFPIGVSIRDYE